MLSYGLFNFLLIAVTTSKLFVTSARLQFQLQLVNVVFRHGDRTPASYENGELYPNDPYLNWTFPKGYEQLTNAGKVRSYSLGRHLYRLYGSFLNHLYEPEEVYARSSDTDRAKMTLQVVLSGLFPPKHYDQWHPLLKWQPISTVYCPKKSDMILRPETSERWDIRSADEHKAAYKALLSPAVTSRIAPYDELLHQLTEWTGRPIKNPLHLLNLYNTLTSEVFLGLKLPAWAENLYSSNVLSDATSLLYQIIDGNQNFKKMLSGILLRRMVDDMLNKVENYGTNKKKIYLYSAHDVNVGSALAALGLYTAPHLPKYTSAVMIELLSLRCDYYVRVSGNELWIKGVPQFLGKNKVRYYEGIPARSTIKTIPNCAEPCPLRQFITLIEDNLASSEEVRDYC